MTLFGFLAIEIDGRVLGPRDFGGVKPKQILEILLLERGRAVPKERLAELLWDDAPPRNVSATLETYVSLVRKHLKKLVRTEPGAYLVATEDVDVDLDRFDALRRRGTRADLEAALALARRDVLEDERYATWAVRERAVYRERVLRTLVDAAEAALAARDPEAALAHAEEATARDRACERAYRAAMRAHAELGRSDEGLAVYQRCRAALAEELGIEPQPETEELRGALRRREPAPPARAHGASRPDAAVVRTVDVPMLGRSGDVALLERSARAALDASSPRTALLLVEGEAGVGKTRVLDELVARLSPLVRRVARARCVALERDLAFAPIAQAIRELAPDALRSGRWSELAEIVPELDGAELAGAATSAGRTRAFEGLVRLLEEQAPAALVLDDLQWADASSLSALAYVLRRSVRAPVIVVGACRSEEVDVDHPLRQLDAAVRVELQPLTRGDLASLGVPELHDKTGGNALLVVEYLRALAEGGAMPAGLRDAVLVRSRGAGPDAHRLLAVASILGRSFDPDVLARMLDTGVDEVLERLEALCQRRLLVACGERFDFRHDLIREVLAASLSPARRKQLHARALEALEQRGADPGELAYHAEASAAHERALRYAVRAGDAARGRWANVESVAHYERALRVAADHPDLLDEPAREALELRRARALTTIGRPVDAEAAIARACAAAEARGDAPALFEALEALGVARQRGASAPSDALAVGERALAVARRIGDPAILGRAHTLVGSPAGSVGKIDLALEHCHAAIAEAERAGLAPSAYPYGRIALMLHHRAREDEAITWTERAESAALAQSDEESLLMARWVRALSLAARARYREARAMLDSIASIGRAEETFWHARVPNTYGAILADTCQYERALERDLESLERVRHDAARPVREVEVHTLLNLADDLLGLGRVKEARERLEAVRRQISDVEYARFRWVSRLHCLDAHLAVVEGDAGRARAAADAALVLAGEYRLPKYEARGRVAMAAASLADGRPAPARKLARAAARVADQAGLPGVSWRAWRLAWKAGGSADDRRRARAAVEQAAAGLEEAARADFVRAAGVRA